MKGCKGVANIALTEAWGAKERLSKALFSTFSISSFSHSLMKVAA